jgi:tetratricopeptide (TPR) repeat protein
MRLALIVTLAALAFPIATSSAPDEPLLLGPICHGEPPPSIAGPHRLVMLTGMGNDHIAADTRSAEAQRWFDYGLTLSRSFEHGDAVLAFQRAEAADPQCSLCVWGEAWASGPNINFGPRASETPRLLALAMKAQALAGPDADAPIKPLEAALVDRYGGAGGDAAYAHDLDALQRAHPDDVEVAIFDAEAWLIMENSHDDPSGPTRAVQVLEPLLPAHPDYSGLIHFYVHATEDAGIAERAAPYAAKLALLAPSASHMVHMPSHTWYRLGRYEDAARANVAALDADLAYAEKTDTPTPLGRLTYHFHDIQFGLGAAMLSGDRAIALKLVRQFDQDFPTPATFISRDEGAAAQAFAAFGRFAPPQAVLAEPDTVSAKPYLEAMRHYARGEAYLRLGQADRAGAEAALVVAPAGGSVTALHATLTLIAQLTLQGDVDLLDHKTDAAVDAFTKAAAIQEARLVRNDDPPAWWYPVRRSLAAALLAKGNAAGTVRESTTVLQTWKLDPVTLAIRAQAERRLGQPGARQDQAEARSAWRGGAALLRDSAAA